MAPRRRSDQTPVTTSSQPIPPSSQNQDDNDNQSANDDPTPAEVDFNSNSTPIADADDGEEHLKSTVWQYAKKISPVQAQCNICKSYIGTNRSGTTTLRKHLIHKHKINHLILVSSTSKPTSSFQKDKKIHLDHLANLAIFEDGRTFGDLRRPGLRKFLSEAIPDKVHIFSTT